MPGKRPQAIDPMLVVIAHPIGEPIAKKAARDGDKINRPKRDAGFAYQRPSPSKIIVAGSSSDKNANDSPKASKKTMGMAQT